jgi:hypothetical protein
MALYTDGLALFGHESTAEGRDLKSAVQRALTAQGVSHPVAPSPQAQGRIERRFGSLQGRVVTLLGYEKVPSFAHAQVDLQAEIDPSTAPSSGPRSCPLTTNQTGPYRMA